MLLNDIVGLYIEPTNICTLKCPGCARTRFIDQWPQHWKNHSIDIDQVNQFLDIDLKDKQILLGGNYGDPIYHPEFHQLIKTFKQRGANLIIVTNGSHRSADWWATTTSILANNDQVVFSVDGMPDNFTQYRINADWDTIQQAMQLCASASCRTIWKYIPFAFNEQDIHQAQELSKSMGIDIFQFDPSDRFDDQTKNYQPVVEYLGARYQSQQSWKQHAGQPALNPKCADNKNHYISADGYYSPCCYAADHRFYYKTEFGKNKKSYRITDQTLSQILTQPAVVEFYGDLTNQPVCQYNCPAT